MRKNGKGRRFAAVAAAVSLVILLTPPAGAAGFPLMKTSRAPAHQVKTLIPVGQTVGMKIFADGIMVVDISTVATEQGSAQPAADAGIKKGDLIVRINGREVSTAQEFAKVVAESGGQAIELLVQRNGAQFTVSVVPVKSSADGSYKTGMMVRDSVAGIGTITFYDPETGVFGALGHGINDTETGQLVTISGGEIVSGKVTGVIPGEKGAPGMLRGEFLPTNTIGSIYANTPKGVFGFLNKEFVKGFNRELEVADISQIHEGEATILSNVDGNEIEEYTVVIEAIFTDTDQRNLLITVTDQRLLDKTGGIVQGMSGSPIIQDGRFVGAVTHVLVNDPTSGYGIFAENMLFEGFSNYQEKAA